MISIPILIPTRYTLQLTFSKDFSTFNGHVELTYDTVEYFSNLRTYEYDNNIQVPEKMSKTLKLNSASNCNIQSIFANQGTSSKKLEIEEHINDSSSPNGSNAVASEEFTESDISNKSKVKRLINKKKDTRKKKDSQKVSIQNHTSHIQEKEIIIYIPELEEYSSSRLTVEIGYTGVVRKDKLFHGIYLCGLKQSVLCTMFEPRYACTVFPCVDQTEYRSYFDLTLTYTSLNNNLIALSNYPIVMKKQSRDGTVTCKFECSNIPLPVYLLGFTIGEYKSLQEFKYSSSYTTSEITISVYAHQSSLSKVNGDMIVQVTKFSMQRLEKRFGIGFSLPKLDVVIVPSLCIGGMENHGCIILNEDACASSSSKDQKYEEFVELIIHEVSHYYVGNITGFPFWIKEGLAQYYQYHLADKYFERKNPHPKLKHRSIGGNHEYTGRAKGKSINDEFKILMTSANYENSLQLILDIESKIGEGEFKKQIASLISIYCGKFVNESQFIEFMLQK